MISSADLPVPIPTALVGKRILPRSYQIDDATTLLAAIDESRAFLRPWVGWGDRYQTFAREVAGRRPTHNGYTALAGEHFAPPASGTATSATRR